MTTKQDNIFQNYDEIKYAIFCDGLEKQYKNSENEGVFEVLKVLELDKEHLDCNIFQAVEYFKQNDGVIDKDAPMGFLTEFEKLMVHIGTRFRSELYCMLLSKKFAEAIENKTIFLQHSFKYSFNN